MPQAANRLPPLWIDLDIGIPFTRYDSDDKHNFRVKKAFFDVYDGFVDWKAAWEFRELIHAMNDHKGTLQILSRRPVPCALKEKLQCVWNEACEAYIEYYVECTETPGKYVLSEGVDCTN